MAGEAELTNGQRIFVVLFFATITTILWVWLGTYIEKSRPKPPPARAWEIYVEAQETELSRHSAAMDGE